MSAYVMKKTFWRSTTMKAAPRIAVEKPRCGIGFSQVTNYFISLVFIPVLINVITRVRQIGLILGPLIANPFKLR